MRLIISLLAACSLCIGEEAGQHGIFWLKDGRKIQGYWDPKSPLGPGIFVTTSTNELLVDKRTGQVFVGSVPGTGQHFPATESDFIDRSPPEQTYVSDPIQIGEGSSETDISLLNSTHPTLPLSYIKTPKKSEEVFYLIEACRGDERKIRIWQPSPSYEKGRPAIVLLGEPRSRDAQQGTRSLQVFLLERGACLYDRSIPAPLWFDAKFQEAQAVAKAKGIGIWTKENSEWVESELKKQASPTKGKK